VLSLPAHPLLARNLEKRRKQEELKGTNLNNVHCWTPWHSLRTTMEMMPPKWTKSIRKSLPQRCLSSLRKDEFVQDDHLAAPRSYLHYRQTRRQTDVDGLYWTLGTPCWWRWRLSCCLLVQIRCRRPSRLGYS
jgi:hypothetical protein